MEHSSKNNEATTRRGKVYIWVFVAAIATPILLILVSVIALRWVDPSATSFTLREDTDPFFLQTERELEKPLNTPTDSILQDADTTLNFLNES